MWIAILGIICLTILGLYGKLDVAGPIATCVVAIAGANAAQGILEKKQDVPK
jgi:hypothetical protein